MLTLALFFACSASPEAAGQASIGVTQDEHDAALDRIEALEQQVAALQAITGTAPVEDANGDGFRDSDGMPVGTRRGDVLWEGRCEDGDLSLQIPGWLVEPDTGPGQIPPRVPYVSWTCPEDRPCESSGGWWRTDLVSCDLLRGSRFVVTLD